MLAMVEAEHRKVVELIKADREKMINLVEAAHGRNKQLADQFVEGVIAGWRSGCGTPLNLIASMTRTSAMRRKERN